MAGENYDKDKEYLFCTVGERYRVIRKTLEKYRDSKVLRPYPFNSGYFMAFDTMGRNAEELGEIPGWSNQYHGQDTETGLLLSGEGKP